MSNSSSGSRKTTSLWEFFSLPAISAGFVAVLVGYTSSAVIIFQAATALGATSEELSSWLWALGLGMGLTSIGLSLFYKVPILTAWSTPGAALLVTSVEGLSLNDAIGVFIFSSSLIVICGLTGWFNKLVKHLPLPLASAMLAGVLFQFGLNAFGVLQNDILLAGIMIASYILLKRFLPRFAIVSVLAVGVILVYFQGRLSVSDIALEFSMPVWTSPTFTLESLIGVGLPLFIVTMASQNVPGIAVLKANNFSPPISPLISWTGISGLVLAPFGGYAFNLAAITAAICMGDDTGTRRENRYFATVWAGIFYLFTGVFGATVALLFVAFPSELIMLIAGLALLGTIANSLATALSGSDAREAALITFLVTASGSNILGISSAFWGLCIGLFVFHLTKKSAS